LPALPCGKDLVFVRVDTVDEAAYEDVIEEVRGEVRQSAKSRSLKKGRR
jgi:hypothetical protein